MSETRSGNSEAPEVINSLPPTTTIQEDMIKAGQRRINLIWEMTQALVTLIVTSAAIYCAIMGIDSKVVDYGFIAVVSTYLARTNHTKIGGVGANEIGR